MKRFMDLVVTAFGAITRILTLLILFLMELELEVSRCSCSFWSAWARALRGTLNRDVTQQLRPQDREREGSQQQKK